MAMSSQDYLAEAQRYDRLAREARNQVVTACSPEYYDNMAELMRKHAGSVHSAFAGYLPKIDSYES